MDEIDLVRELRARLPEAGPEQVARARQTLLERITAEESVDEHQSTSPRKGRRWHVRRRGLGVAAAAAVALAVAVVILVPGGGGSQSAAAAVLRRVAAVAAGQTPGQAPKPGQYAYTRSRGADLKVNSSWSFLVPYLRQTWIAPDGTGRLRETDGRPRFLSARDRAAWVADGSHQSDLAGRQTTDQTFGKRSYPSLSKLPTDPSELRRVLIAAENKPPRSCFATPSRPKGWKPPATPTCIIAAMVGRPSAETPIPNFFKGQSETFVVIGRLLGETYAPPAVRSALYQVAAELPGVKLLGQVKDPVGRTGIGVAYRDEQHGQEHELIFNPGTSALLAERDVLLDPKKAGLKAPAGTVFGYAVYLQSGVVDSTSSVPAR